MTNHDEDAFGDLMLGIGEAFGEAVSPMRIEVYFRALSDLPIGAIRAAAEQIVKHGRFFPRPAEIREAIEGSSDDRAELAWTEVLRLVRRYGYPGIDGQGKPPAFPDAATERAALELYGGWAALCERLPGAGPELLGVRKAFVASYAAHARQDQRALALPPSREDAKAQLAGVKRALESRGLPSGAL